MLQYTVVIDVEMNIRMLYYIRSMVVKNIIQLETTLPWLIS